MDTKKKYGNYGTYGSSTGKKVDSKAIEADFKKYADPSTNKISPGRHYS